MRIAFVLSRCSNLGPFIVARDLVNNLYKLVEQVDVFYIKESPEKLSFKTNCTKIRFTEAIDFSNYDIIHSHGFVADAYMFAHRKRLKGVHITTLHQRIEPDYAMKYNFLFGYLFEKIWLSLISKKTFIVTLSKVMERYYEKKVRSNEMTSIYNGIEIPDCSCKISREEEDQILKLKSNYHIIGVTARLIFLKGIDQVIKSLLVNKDFALVIIGNGEKEKELMQLSKELEVDDRCLFLGYKKCVLPYLKLFDVYAMSSRSEGFGLSVMEAASQKVPVVCSNLPVFEEIFTNNEVVSFELENIDSLATAFREAVCERPKFSEALYSKFNANFTADKMANNYLQLYQRLLYR